MTASERRNAILEDLCMRRFKKVGNLAFQYGVTARTIRFTPQKATEAVFM